MAGTEVVFTATSQLWSTLTNASGGLNGTKRMITDTHISRLGAGMLSISAQGVWTNGSVVTLRRRKILPSNDGTWNNTSLVLSASRTNVPAEDDITNLSPAFEYDWICTSFVAGDSPTVDFP